MDEPVNTDLICPLCEAVVAYESVLAVANADDKCQCPTCKQISDTKEWFE
jgi:hypothetical protein